MEFIENNEKYGIKYDLTKIAKEYKKLKIPSEFDFIDFNRIENNSYIIDLSPRSVGKTTCYLLLGLVYNKLYGTHIVYIRENSDMIKASIVQDLFKVILSYKDGYYLKKITDGKYTGIYYHWRKLYFCNYDDKGNVTDKTAEPFLDFLSITEHETYKSTLNLPTGDFVIFDEFISRYYTTNACYMFLDTLKTVFRKRKSGKIFMLANNTNINSPWFEELTIYKQIRTLKKGQTIDCKSDGGTTFSIHFINPENQKEQKEQNRLFFGFNNPKLSAITGVGEWNVEEVQHIPKDFDFVLQFKKMFIRVAPSEYVSLELGTHDDEPCALVKRATRIFDDDIVFTLSDKNEYKNGFYKFGDDKMLSLVIEYIEQNRIYYSTNEVGNDFKNYVRLCKDSKFR